MPLTQVSGVNDSSSPGSSVDFTSRNEDRLTVTEVPIISENDDGPAQGPGVRAGRGCAAVKLRMPLPDASHDPHAGRPDALAEQMAASYRTADHWFDDSPDHLPAAGGCGMNASAAQVQNRRSHAGQQATDGTPGVLRATLRLLFWLFVAHCCFRSSSSGSACCSGGPSKVQPTARRCCRTSWLPVG